MGGEWCLSLLGNTRAVAVYSAKHSLRARCVFTATSCNLLEDFPNRFRNLQLSKMETSNTSTRTKNILNFIDRLVAENNDLTAKCEYLTKQNITAYQNLTKFVKELEVNMIYHQFNWFLNFRKSGWNINVLAGIWLPIRKLLLNWW